MVGDEGLELPELLGWILRHRRVETCAERPEVLLGQLADVVADAAREAMAQNISLGGCLAAGFLLAGLLATMLISAKKRQEGPVRV